MAKLLLAEDDEFSRDMLVRRLERSGYETLAAPDGREAWRLARLHRPDLILMDLDMPVMDGRTAIRKLKSDPLTSPIPIIVLTAHTSVEDVAGAVGAGCQAYEAKPIVFRRLLERIEGLLQAVRPE
ncbi:Response regulator receiver domain [Candidatus Sulfopaludibacter sp. SbA4]|nr:Response regulator receiver domain [Candidatus Sulfopaludibacter sp. SbA4]